MICLACASMSVRFWTSATRSFSRLWASVSACSASSSACCSSRVRCSTNSAVWASTCSRVRWRARRLRSPMNESSSSSESIAFRKNVTLSKLRLPGATSRIWKNCSLMKSRSATTTRFRGPSVVQSEPDSSAAAAASSVSSSPGSADSSASSDSADASDSLDDSDSADASAALTAPASVSADPAASVSAASSAAGVSDSSSAAVSLPAPASSLAVSSAPGASAAVSSAASGADAAGPARLTRAATTKSSSSCSRTGLGLMEGPKKLCRTIEK